MRIGLWLCGLLLFVTGCGPGDESNNTSAAAPAAPTAPAPPAAPTPAGEPAYPTLPLDKLEYLWENCDYIDFIFYSTNFSMNQHEQQGIRGTLAGISSEAPVIDPACKPIGRVFFQVQGANEAEADLYLAPTCIYYVFLENNKPVYANKLTQQGLAFYVNIFQQVQGQGQ